MTKVQMCTGERGNIKRNDDVEQSLNDPMSGRMTKVQIMCTGERGNITRNDECRTVSKRPNVGQNDEGTDVYRRERHV